VGEFAAEASAQAVLIQVPGAQADEEEFESDSNEVSNDDPSRPIQMPPASTEVKEAIEDFERFQRRGAWERAFKALEGIPEDQQDRFVDGEDGFIIPVSLKRRMLLESLPTEGRVAYRLFRDAEARRLLDEAKAADAEEELATLERLVSAYFLTEVGDEAADRLGDCYFERGRFEKAADAWLDVVRQRPGTELSIDRLLVKAALALARAGRFERLKRVRRELEERPAGEPLTIGGRTAAPLALLDAWVEELKAESSASGRGGEAARFALPEDPEPLWQVRIAETIEAGMSAPERERWRVGPLYSVAPVAAVGGSRLFVNYVGKAFAVDLETGKLLWRSSPFHDVEQIASRFQSRSYGTNLEDRFEVAAAEDRAWFLGPELDNPRRGLTAQLTCRSAEDGAVLWSSENLDDYEGLDFVGRPLVVGDRLIIGANAASNRGQPPELAVLAIRASDGEILWRTAIGMSRQSNPYSYYYGSNSGTPLRFLLDAGTLYAETHEGILARLDFETGELEWGFGYPTEPIQGRQRFIVYRNQPGPSAREGGRPVRFGGLLLVKGLKSSRIQALDPAARKRVWTRPISKASRPLATQDNELLLGGAELSSLGLETLELRWALRVPGGSEAGRVIVDAERLWQLTPRGIFEVDPATGQIRRIVRGADLGAAPGGALIRADDRLLAVSNQAITAYPLVEAGRPQDVENEIGAARTGIEERRAARLEPGG